MQAQPGPAQPAPAPSANADQTGHENDIFTVVGPDGGDARAFASEPGNPSHLYLGTTNSWLYESRDAGASWHRLAKLGRGDGFVIDHVIVDPTNSSTLYAGAWKDSTDGGIWISHDSGHTWTEVPLFQGQPVLSLAQAPSDPTILFAGTLQGVFRSTDSGADWAQISPPKSHEIHEIESLAIDPKNPDIVYAGTWHLPWKTTDGGKTWRNIKQGVIVDSDVFSIIVDPQTTRTVYLSACSGIYKSANAGLLFRKIHGIPSEARRTRVLRQDPAHLNVVYAGTTEGLYKTSDAGKTFERMTDPDVIVNDVYVDPANSDRVLLATDRSGVLVSNDAAHTFAQSNAGISERKIAGLVVDRNDPQRIYAGVVNDKRFGGVFKSNDGGAHWQQLAAGLDGRDVFSLAQAKDGSIVAGTSHGIFVLSDGSNASAPQTQVATNGMAPPVSTLRPGNEDVSNSKKEAGVPQVPGTREPGNDQAHSSTDPTPSTSSSASPVSTNCPGDESTNGAADGSTKCQGTTSVVPQNAQNNSGALAPAAASSTDPAPTANVSTNPLSTWQPRNTIAPTILITTTQKIDATNVTTQKSVAAPPVQLESLINALDVSGDIWVAATSYGLVTSHDQGASWQGGPVMGQGNFLSVTAHGNDLVAARDNTVVISHDAGQSWWPLGIPTMLTHIHRVAFAPDGTLWLGAREGVYFTRDLGKSWLWIHRLPLNDIDDLSVDPVSHRILVSSNLSDQIYAIDPKTMTWVWWQTGFQIALIRAAGDHLVAASLDDGVLIGPKVPPAAAVTADEPVK